MRLFHASVVAMAAAALVSTLGARQQDADIKVANGGIHVAGWMGRPDAGAVADARLAQDGANLHAQTGPAISYWNPANTASGDYMVKATFTEAKQTMTHPHPFGLFIGGSDLGTDNHTLLYCVAYRNARALVRGFSGATPFNVFSTPRGQAQAGVNTAAADQPVTQEIQWMVMNGTAECSINGQSVGKFAAADVVGAGKLKSLDGVYGLRIAHNVDVKIAGFSMMKH